MFGESNTGVTASSICCPRMKIGKSYTINSLYAIDANRRSKDAKRSRRASIICVLTNGAQLLMYLVSLLIFYSCIIRYCTRLIIDVQVGTAMTPHALRHSLLYSLCNRYSYVVLYSPCTRYSHGVLYSQCTRYSYGVLYSLCTRNSYGVLYSPCTRYSHAVLYSPCTRYSYVLPM